MLAHRPRRRARGARRAASSRAASSSGSRSLARSSIGPAVLLLDEPLSALDVKLRKQMQLELKAIQHQLGTTFVYVTHDQEEALLMSDRIGIMNHGRLLQVGTPREHLRAAGGRLRGRLRGLASTSSSVGSRDGRGQGGDRARGEGDVLARRMRRRCRTADCGSGCGRSACRIAVCRRWKGAGWAGQCVTWSASAPVVHVVVDVPKRGRSCARGSATPAGLRRRAGEAAR